MNVEFVSVTEPNLANVEGDSLSVFDGMGTFAENLCEYAGRVCYKSTTKMGHAPNFLRDRIREGHEDIIEHVVVTVMFQSELDDFFTNSFGLHKLCVVNRHCEMSGNEWSGKQYVSGNLRVWLDFFRRSMLLDALPILTAIAPSVFAEFHSTHASLPYPQATCFAQTTARRQQRITLLGANIPILSAEHLFRHGTATFLFEGISRACTHQIVRHRLGSHSQQSQRYVDLAKGGWDAIIPPAIAENDRAASIMDDFWKESERSYIALRNLGIRKEDARFLLPNAAETRIVVTMNFAAWNHFIYLRAAKNAQWEVRDVAVQVLEQLHQIAPKAFGGDE